MQVVEDIYQWISDNYPDSSGIIYCFSKKEAKSTNMIKSKRPTQTQTVQAGSKWILGLAPSTILETSDVSAICEIMPKTEEELNLILSDQKVRICGKEVLKIINGKSTNSTITTTTTTIKPVLDLSIDDDFQEKKSKKWRSEVKAMSLIV